MSNEGLEVIVIAKLESDLPNLAESTGPLAVPCGTSGPSIAKKVLEGNGQTTISIKILQSAFETQSGVDGILDNFELYDAKTKRPLIFSLISNHLKGK